MFKLIGVTGKTGAGKTTFSDMLGRKDNVGVIHVDDILKEFKLKYFKPFLSQDKNGEKTKINSNLKTILYGNKLVFELFMRFRAKLVEKAIDEQIQKLIQEKKQTIIIDDIFIKYMKRYKDFSKVYIVKRPFVERKEAIKQRDGLTREEIVAVDVAHYKENYKEIYKDPNVEVINNNGTKEELDNIVDGIYKEQLISINFKEKYKQNDLDNRVMEKSFKIDINMRTKKEKESR